MPGVTGAELRALCLGLPGTREEFPFRPGLSVTDDGSLPAGLVRDLVTGSFELVAAKLPGRARGSPRA